MNQGISAVLLVEDKRSDVLLLLRAFRQAGLPFPLHVSDGQAAIDYLSGAGSYRDRTQHPLPALVLLDLKLPRKNGLEVLAWLHEQEGLRCIPVVVLTSSREQSDVEQAYQLGANSYLVKPTTPDRLLEMIRTLDLYWMKLNEGPELVLPRSTT